MAQEKFDSGHAILPVVHPSGEVHQISVPLDTPFSDLHDALKDYYHQEPTEAGALENTPAFRNAAAKAWDAAANGLLRQEAGAIYFKNPLFKPEQLPAQKGAEMKIDVPPDAFATLHTHPNDQRQDPSQQDIDTARKTNKPLFVASRQGLYMVRPSDGKVLQVFQGTDWMKPKKEGKK